MKEFLSLSYSQLRRNYVIFSGVGINPIEVLLVKIVTYTVHDNYALCIMNYALELFRWLLRRGPTSSHSEQRS